MPTATNTLNVVPEKCKGKKKKTRNTFPEHLFNLTRENYKEIEIINKTSKIIIAYKCIFPNMSVFDNLTKLKKNRNINQV